MDRRKDIYIPLLFSFLMLGVFFGGVGSRAATKKYIGKTVGDCVNEYNNSIKTREAVASGGSHHNPSVSNGGSYTRYFTFWSYNGGYYYYYHCDHGGGYQPNGASHSEGVGVCPSLYTNEYIVHGEYGSDTSTLNAQGVPYPFDPYEHTYHNQLSTDYMYEYYDSRQECYWSESVGSLIKNYNEICDSIRAYLSYNKKNPNPEKEDDGYYLAVHAFSSDTVKWYNYWVQQKAEYEQNIFPIAVFYYAPNYRVSYAFGWNDTSRPLGGVNVAGFPTEFCSSDGINVGGYTPTKSGYTFRTWVNPSIGVGTYRDVTVWGIFDRNYRHLTMNAGDSAKFNDNSTQKDKYVYQFSPYNSTADITNNTENLNTTLPIPKRKGYSYKWKVTNGVDAEGNDESGTFIEGTDEMK